MGNRVWAGDESGRLYMVERRDGCLRIYGPVPSTAAHLPELSLVIYAAAAFGSLAAGLTRVALGAMLAALVGVPALAVAVRARYVRGEGLRAEARSSEDLGGRIVKLTLDVEGVGRLVLYARGKDLRGWALPHGPQPLASSSQ
ncbi:MAG: hypothetical protein ACP5ID_04365 [Conexivisphaera sp.]